MPRRGRSFRHTAGYWLLRGLLAGARPAPLGALAAAGAAVGRLLLRGARKDRGRAQTNIRLAFPDRDETWRRALMVRTADHLGRLLGEVAWLWSVPPTALLERTEMVGLDNLTGSLAQAGGAVLLTGHCGNWEWMNLALGAAGVPMTVAAREVFDPRYDRLVHRLRGRFGGATALRGKGAGGLLFQALKRGRVVGILIDQDIDAPGVFVEFFGRPAWTPPGAAVLAMRSGVPIVPGFATRLPGGRMRLAFDPPIQPPPAENIDEAAAELTARLTLRIEEQIRAHPEQWVWMHQRWKHQPGDDQRVWRGTNGQSAEGQPG